MDAYTDFMTQLAQAKLEALRREAAQERLARSLAARRTAKAQAGRAWFGIGARLRRRGAQRGQPELVAQAQEELRRTA